MELVTSIHPAEAAGQLLTDALLRLTGPVLLLVSGGSALQLLDFVTETTLNSRVTLSVLDERFSTDPMINNFAQLEQTAFFAAAIARGVAIISTKVTPLDSLVILRDRFDSALRAWRTTHPKGVIIATMGIGPDGHTAGIFPGDYGVTWTGDAWIVGYSVPCTVNSNPNRVSVTDTFLTTQVNEAIVYAVGPLKQALISQLQNGICDRTCLPMCVIRQMRHVTIVSSEPI